MYHVCCDFEPRYGIFEKASIMMFRRDAIYQQRMEIVGVCFWKGTGQNAYTYNTFEIAYENPSPPLPPTPPQNNKLSSVAGIAGYRASTPQSDRKAACLALWQGTLATGVAHLKLSHKQHDMPLDLYP